MQLMDDHYSIRRFFHAAVQPATGFLKDRFHKATDFVEGKLPDFVPRDRTTKFIVGAGVVAYVADMWDPVPIGETIALGCAGAATARGAWLAYRDAHAHPYIQTLGLHD